MSEKREKAAEAVIKEEVKEFDTPMEIEVHEDRTREFRTLGFMRMRMDWANEEDRITMETITRSIDDRINEKFSDAYAILNDIYEIVRVPKTDPETGEVLTDRWGWPLWEQTESGRYIEDYSKLGIKERENFVMQITVRLFGWSQDAAAIHSESMFTKGEWESKFAHAFMDDSLGGRKTDEAFTQRARSNSREERYFGLYWSGVSRKAEAVVKSMELIALRLSQSTK